MSAEDYKRRKGQIVVKTLLEGDMKQVQRPYFITFGAGHPFHKHVVGVVAPSMEKAREGIRNIFGLHWGFMYEAEDRKEGYAVQVCRFGLKMLVAIEWSDSMWVTIDKERFLRVIKEASRARR